MDRHEIELVTKFNCMSLFLSQLSRYLEEDIEPMMIKGIDESGFLETQQTIVNKIKQLKSKANGGICSKTDS